LQQEYKLPEIRILRESETGMGIHVVFAWNAERKSRSTPTTITWLSLQQLLTEWLCFTAIKLKAMLQCSM
jgi:hypothetical protein